MVAMIGLWQQHLQHRIVLSVVLGLGVILLLLGLVAFWTIQQSIQAAYAERVTLAEVLAQRVTDVFTYELALLEHEAGEPEHGTVNLHLAAGVPPSEEEQGLLADLRLEMRTPAILSLTDAAGHTILTESGREGAAISAPPRYPCVQMALATGEPHLSELAPAGVGGRVFACLAVPLRDTYGQLIGALVAGVDPRDQALSIMPSADVGAGGMHAQLVNAAGSVLAGTASPFAGDAEEHLVLLNDLVRAQTAGFRIHGQGGPLSSGGHLVAYAPVSILNTWGIVIEQRTDAVVAAPRRLAERLSVFVLLALALTGAVAWADVSHVVRPLNHLTAAAERFAAGRLDTPVQLEQANRPDEVGILARSFETMRRRLSGSLQEIAAWNRELEGRVAARTAEVEARSQEMAELYARLQARERERAELLQRYMAGQEEERRRLAQELHDETSQALASLQLGLERLAVGTTTPDEARQLARQLQGVAAQTLEEVHRLAVELRPSVLDDVGLVAAVERYLKECARRTGLSVDFASVEAQGFRLIPAAETAVYRIIQGALTNVVQHAQAKHVSVLLERRDGKLVVVVEDDGKGFDLAGVRSGPLDARLGLAGMEERTALIGAALTIETAPGAGATVFLEVPLDLNTRMEEDHGQAANRAG